MMGVGELFEAYPHLTTPVHLGLAWDSGWQTPRHLWKVNELLWQVFHGEVMRLLVNMPQQHGKSQLVSRVFPAWYLLLKPDTRIIVVGHNTEFAVSQYGLVILEIFDRFGTELGYAIRENAKAKGEWRVEGHRGSVTCLGWQAGVAGRPADLLVIDDLIKNPEQALSEVILEQHWRFIQSVVYGRLRRESRLVDVGTRWARRDSFGRLLDMAARSGEKFVHVKYKAIADADDEDGLGRKQGEALWPEQVSLPQLERERQEMGRWFRACRQQEPEDEEGSIFKPYHWPRYGDLGHAYTLVTGGLRQIVLVSDVLRFVVVDWGLSPKAKANYTAIGTWGLLGDGRLLLLYMRCERVPLERAAALLDEECRRWQPAFGVAEAEHFQAALVTEARRYANIPELRPVKTGSKNKLLRALPATVMGENGRILLPDPALCTPGANGDDYYADAWGWLEQYQARLAAFTGVGDEKDDEVDVTAYAAHQATILRGAGRPLDEGNEPCLLTPGKDSSGWMFG
jgi:hypothetical protein